MSAILDRMLGIDKHKQKKRHTNDESRHHHRRRTESDKPQAGRSRAAPVQLASGVTTARDPQTSEDLRRARVDYWLRPAEERGRQDDLPAGERSQFTVSSVSFRSQILRENDKTMSRAKEGRPSDLTTRTAGRRHNSSGSNSGYTNVYGSSSRTTEGLSAETRLRESTIDVNRHLRRSSKTAAPTAFVRRTDTIRRSNDTTSVTSSRPALHRSRTTGQVRVDSQSFPAASNRSKLTAPSEAASKASRHPWRQMQARIPTLSPVTETSPVNITERPQPRRRQTEPPSKMIECSICAEELLSTQIELLACGHKWCHSCLKRTHFITIDGHYIDKEPKCCNQLIHLSIAASVLSPMEQKYWNRKMREKKTENPIYCPTKSCNNRWISPRHIFREGGKQTARCTRCNNKVCVACKKSAHRSRNCIKDYTDKEMLVYASKEGWKQCPKCKIVIQRDHGCTHMTCRNCGENFCYSCRVAYTNLRKNCTCELIDAIPDDAEDAEMARRVQFGQWADMIAHGEAILTRHAPVRGPGAAAALLNTWLADLNLQDVARGHPLRRIGAAPDAPGLAAAPTDRWHANRDLHTFLARVPAIDQRNMAVAANEWHVEEGASIEPGGNHRPDGGQRPRGHVSNNWFAGDIHD